MVVAHATIGWGHPCTHECQKLCHIVAGSDRLASYMGSFNSAKKNSWHWYIGSLACGAIIYKTESTTS
jgi:hypothetical protein